MKSSNISKKTNVSTGNFSILTYNLLNVQLRKQIVSDS